MKKDTQKDHGGTGACRCIFLSEKKRISRLDYNQTAQISQIKLQLKKMQLRCGANPLAIVWKVM